MGRAPARAEPKLRRSSIAYDVTRWLARFLMAHFTRPIVTGVDRIPPTGGVIVASNHLSIADPAVLMAVSPRRLAYLAKEELFRPWYGRVLFSTWGGVPIRREDMDLGAIRVALRLLKGGEALVVFPEGTRRPEGLGKPHGGVAYLASRSGCPVVPVAIGGTEKIQGFGSLPSRPAFQVAVGEPFTIGPRDWEGGGEMVMHRIETLLTLQRREELILPRPLGGEAGPRSGPGEGADLRGTPPRLLGRRQ